MAQKHFIIGGHGFVGGAIGAELENRRKSCKFISRNDIDLAASDCPAYIKSSINDGDIVIIAAAKAPAKNLDDVYENITIISNIIEGIREKKIAYILNVSSDAVYSDPAGLIDENSMTAPQSAHGIMHCMRELLLKRNLSGVIGTIRPTLIFGSGDPHNGYGPNSFIRCGLEGRDINLFGEGEELRDHIFVGDVAKIAAQMIENLHNGHINAVTGKVISFSNIASIIRSKSLKPIAICQVERNGPMPHNGYRAFDNKSALELLKNYKFKTIEEFVDESFSDAN